MQGNKLVAGDEFVGSRTFLLKQQDVVGTFTAKAVDSFRKLPKGVDFDQQLHDDQFRRFAR